MAIAADDLAPHVAQVFTVGWTGRRLYWGRMLSTYAISGPKNHTDIYKYIYMITTIQNRNKHVCVQSPESVWVCFKDKTVSWPSHLDNGNPYTVRRGFFYIQSTHWLPYITQTLITQRAQDAIIPSLWRQNDVPASFWRHNDVIFTLCVHYWGPPPRGLSPKTFLVMTWFLDV